MNWIELKEGCEMPDYDVPVLWRTEDGNYFVREIDKDDPAWWNGEPECEGRSWVPKLTHWSHISDPEDQEELWLLVKETLYWLGKMPNSLIDPVILRLKEKYTISRK